MSDLQKLAQLGRVSGDRIRSAQRRGRALLEYPAPAAAARPRTFTVRLAGANSVEVCGGHAIRYVAGAQKLIALSVDTGTSGDPADVKTLSGIAATTHIVTDLNASLLPTSLAASSTGSATYPTGDTDYTRRVLAKVTVAGGVITRIVQLEDGDWRDPWLQPDEISTDYSPDGLLQWRNYHNASAYEIVEPEPYFSMLGVIPYEGAPLEYMYLHMIAAYHDHDDLYSLLGHEHMWEELTDTDGSPTSALDGFIPVTAGGKLTLSNPVDMGLFWALGGSYDTAYGESIGDSLTSLTIGLDDGILYGDWSVAARLLEPGNFDVAGSLDVGGGAEIGDLVGGTGNLDVGGDGGFGGQVSAADGFAIDALNAWDLAYLLVEESAGIRMEAPGGLLVNSAGSFEIYATADLDISWVGALNINSETFSAIDIIAPTGSINNPYRKIRLLGVDLGDA